MARSTKRGRAGSKAKPDRRAAPGTVSGKKPSAKPAPPINMALLGGLAWPPLPRSGNIQSMALQVMLSTTEWWPREKLLDHQLVQLQALIDHAAKTVPFYGERLGILPGRPPGTLTLADVRQLPVMRRTDIQDAGDDLVTRALPPSHGQMFDVRTSGSTGRPLVIKGTSLAEMFFRAQGLRYHMWHKRDLTLKSMTVKSLEPGTTVKKTTGWVSGIPSRPGLTVNHILPAPRILEILLREDPDYLQIHPSTLRELLRLSRESGKTPGRLREVRSVSEVLDPEVREMCESQWGVKVADNYSAQEINIIALQCPDHPQYLHVQSENVLLEVLDDRGNPCEPGQLGRCVATTLTNFGSPLIRYEYGDYAEMGEPCPCGRGLPTLRRVAGRERNLFVLPNGDRMTPRLPHAALMNELPIRQFQLVQTSPRDIEIRLAVMRPMSAAEEKQLTDFFTRNQNQPLRFSIAYLEEIPKLPSGKYEIVRSEVTG